MGLFPKVRNKRKQHLSYFWRINNSVAKVRQMRQGYSRLKETNEKAWGWKGKACFEKLGQSKSSVGETEDVGINCFEMRLEDILGLTVECFLCLRIRSTFQKKYLTVRLLSSELLSWLKKDTGISELQCVVSNSLYQLYELINKFSKTLQTGC